MIGRMKAHWPERVNPTMELRSARRWLMDHIKEKPPGCTAPNVDIYRAFSVVSAVAIIDDILERWDQIPEGGRNV